MIKVDDLIAFSSQRKSLGKSHSVSIGDAEAFSYHTIFDTFVPATAQRPKEVTKIIVPNFPKIRTETEKQIKAAVSFPPKEEKKEQKSNKRVREWKNDLDECAENGNFGFIPESLQKYYSGSKRMTWDDFAKSEAGKAVIRYDTFLEKK